MLFRSAPETGVDPTGMTAVSELSATGLPHARQNLLVSGISEAQDIQRVIRGYPATVASRRDFRGITPIPGTHFPAFGSIIDAIPERRFRLQRLWFRSHECSVHELTVHQLSGRPS